jgi:hypothetical protein
MGLRSGLPVLALIKSVVLGPNAAAPDFVAGGRHSTTEVQHVP